MATKSDNDFDTVSQAVAAAMARSTSRGETVTLGVLECSWCGAEISSKEKAHPNREGEVFCTPSHRGSNNRALRRLRGRCERGDEAMLVAKHAAATIGRVKGLLKS